MDNLTMEMRLCAEAGFGVSYGKWKATQPVKEIHKEVRRCEACGKEIHNCNKNRRFCDENCRRNAGYKKKLAAYTMDLSGEPERKCEWCGKPIIDGRKNKRFCDVNCAAQARYWRDKDEQATKAGHD